MKKIVVRFLFAFSLVTIFAINFKVGHKNLFNSSTSSEIELVTNAKAVAEHSGLFYRGYTWTCAVEVIEEDEIRALGIGNHTGCDFSFFSYCNATNCIIVGEIYF